MKKVVVEVNHELYEKHKIPIEVEESQIWDNVRFKDWYGTRSYLPVMMVELNNDEMRVLSDCIHNTVNQCCDSMPVIHAMTREGNYLVNCEYVDQDEGQTRGLRPHTPERGASPYTSPVGWAKLGQSSTSSRKKKDRRCSMCDNCKNLSGCGDYWWCKSYKLMMSSDMTKLPKLPHCSWFKSIWINEKN